MNKIISYIVFCLLISCPSIFAQNFVSPCPNLFSYDSLAEGHWSGTIRPTLDTELSGIWIRTVFDTPFTELTTNFGEAVQREPNEFLIRRPSPKVDAGTTLSIKITVRFNPQSRPPRLLGFRLNGKTVCPEDGVIPPPPSPTDDFVSPCPSLFSYQPLGVEGNRWYGNINVRSEADLSGVWMRVVLDKPPVDLGTNFGEALQKEPSEYLIKNPKHRLNTGDSLQLQIYVDFIPGEVPPKLLGFRLNAKTVCPENGVIAKPVEEFVSPCPSLFTYEPVGNEKDKWRGNVNLLSDVELSGVWMRLLFDNPIQNLETSFGEAVRRGPNDFLVKNPKFSVKIGDRIQYQITAVYNPGDPVPKLSGYRLNGRTVCPENGIVETTTQPIKEQLISPCPETFTYEPLGTEPNIWYGNAILRSPVELNGLWIRIILDKPSLQLGVSENWFGEVKTDDNIIYRIRNPSYLYKPGDSVNLRFFIKYNPNQPLPKLKEIKVNAVTICPGQNSGVSSNFNQGGSTESTIDWLPAPSTKPSVDKPVPGPDWQPNWKPQFVTESPASQNECGVVITKPIPLVHHGIVTEEGKWPWHVALYYQNGAYLEYYCGATLISLRHVLSVAHCVAKKSTKVPISTDDVQVFLGKYQLSKSTRGVQYKQVQNIFIHPDYDTTNYANDIGMILLASPAEYTDWVRPICLWSESTDLNSVENRQGTVVGWGYDNTGRISDRLLKANMPVVSHRKCIWSNKEFYARTLNDRNFCAGFRNGTSVCTGDSGGGLVFPKLNTKSQVWHLRGLVSISVALQDNMSLCDTSHYVIFTDVAKFLNWIQNIMKN